MAVTNYDVCHAWAHNKERAFNGSNLSHGDGVLKSYSTCIGQRLEMNGNVIFILDNNSYSNSTSKHQGYMFNAIPRCEAHVFYVPCAEYGRSYFVSRYGSDNDHKREIVKVGLQMLADDFDHCLAIKTITKLRHGFSSNGYDTMVRLFEVTGATTVKSLLRMKADEFNQLVFRAMRGLYNNGTIRLAEKYFRKFIKLMSEGAAVETIVDAINGKGCWNEYQERITGLKVAEKNRRLSDFVGYCSSRHCSFETYAGRCDAYVSGSVTKKEYVKHQQKGDLIQWLLKIRRKNIQMAAEARLNSEKYHRQREAKQRLEYYVGMAGFATGWSPWGREPRQCFSRFNYNGTVIDFTGVHHCEERHLSNSEYAEFVKCANKAEWITNKRAWMLEQLQNDQREYQERQAYLKEEERMRLAERERYARLQEEKRDYIEQLKAKGEEGYRQLYHEGFNVSLPYSNPTLFYGGNVLLRVNEIRKCVETSKGIRLTISECKRLWPIFERWHKRIEECEKGMVIQSLGSQYKVHSFQNDILTAGCHQIAYREMSFIAHELGLAS